MMMMMDKEEHQHQQKKTSFVHISHNYLAMCGDYHKFSLQFFHCFRPFSSSLSTGTVALSVSVIFITLFDFIYFYQNYFFFVDQIRPIIFG